MSTNYIKDIAKMHAKFGVNEVVRTFDAEKLKKFIEFRINFIEEEFLEMKKAFGEQNADDLVDALIDIIVVAQGTLDALDVDSKEAWGRVLKANMKKKPGVNPSRPNELGLPDMIKPRKWEAPSHADNVGLMSKAFA